MLLDLRVETNRSSAPISSFGSARNHACAVPADAAPISARVSALLAQALRDVFENPTAAHVSITRAASLLHTDEFGTLNSYQPLRVPGALNAWQEQRAKALLEDGLANEVSLEAVANACDLPLSQFNRAFQRTTGLSPTRWQRALRVERAKELLFSSRLSLAQIAYECGFADQSHFTRAFAAATGASPGAWRRARCAM